MAECTTLDFGVIINYYGNNWEDLCCYTPPALTYDDFVTGVTAQYNSECLRDKVFSDYVTQLFNNCLSGASTGHTHGDYWSANTDGSISNSGLTSTNVGVGTINPSYNLDVSGNARVTSSLYVSDISSDSSYMQFWTNKIRIESSGNVGVGIATPLALLHVDGTTILTNDVGISGETNIGSNLGVSGNTEIVGTLSALSNTHLGGTLGVSGKTYLGDVDAVTPTTSDKLLILQTTGEVESITTTQLTGLTENLYWSGGSDGTSIINSGTTPYVGIGTTTPNQKLTVDGRISGTSDVSINGNFIADGASSNDLDLRSAGATCILLKSRGNQNSFIGNDSFLGNVGIGTTTPNVKLSVIGAISASTDLDVGDDIRLVSDESVINMGEGNDVTFTHDGTTGLVIAATPISINSTGDLTLDSSIDIILDATGGNIVFKDNTTVVLTIDIDSSAGDAIFKDAGSTEIFRIDGSEDSLLMASSNKLQFATSTEFIHSSAEGQLTIGASTALIVTVPFVGVGNGASGPGEIRFMESTDDGSDYAAIKTGALGASYTLTLPVDDGDSGEVLSTDGSGVLSWIEAGGGTSYWSANTDGSISPSGITTNVGIGTTTPTGLFEVKDLIKFPETNSTFIGVDSGANWESGSISNTAFGRLSMGLGTMSSAVQNTAIGFASLAYITTGDYNTALGLQANTSIDTGSWNTSLGTTSMFGATYHSYNTAVGANTMYFTTSGSLGKTVPSDTHNTAIGYSSQYYNLNGAYNTSVGSQSIGNSSIAYAGTGSTAMGYKSLFNNTTGNYNTTVGYQAGDNITTGDYNISIGPDADPPSATADYQMNIGGIIHGQDAYSDSAISQVGIGTTGPKVKLDVHHDPTNLADNTGGGEVVTFGTEDGTDTLAAGRLVYLNSSGVWKYTDADAVATGGSQLLGIALGTAVSDGILLRGYFDQVAYIEGTFAKGAPCYVSEATGEIDFTAPSASGDFIRVVGYGTDLANVIYFDPSKTWVELS